jgi:sec-independent protein translocase protein TatA
MDTGVLAEIFGPDGLIVIAVLAVVLLFGGRKLPELARGLGSASHQFKKGIAEGDAEEAAIKAEVKADALKASSNSTH